MNDKFLEAKQRARAQMLAQAEQEKKAFIREIKTGLGEQITKELETIKPPTKGQLFWRRVKKVLGL